MSQFSRRHLLRSGILTAGGLIIRPAISQAESSLDATVPMLSSSWNITIQGPNGHKVPAVLGASGTINSPLGSSGFDYFEWFGITHNRYFFDAQFSTLNPTGGVTDKDSFTAACSAIRANPLRQGTSSDVYIDWQYFYAQFGSDQQYIFARFKLVNIIPIMIMTTVTNDDPLTDWGDKFMFWKLWYAYVYYFASIYGVTMYEFANEPHLDYEKWESHWLVAADAMQKAMADVNTNYNTSLKLYILGPTTPGVWWDESLQDPDVDPHGWGNVSWKKVKTDLNGYVLESISNYGMYDYHSYQLTASKQQSSITSLRQDVANALNAPSSTIPLIITELNTATGATFTAKSLDSEDIQYGIGVSQIVQATTDLGSAGLGDEGGFLLFKIGAARSASLLANSTVYVSALGNNNYGGITRGGVCFQLYARHFRGGKPVLGSQTTAGADAQRLAVAVYDSVIEAYYIYVSNVSGTSATLSLDLSALDVQTSSPLSIARVDVNNTGEIMQILSMPASKIVSIPAPNDGAALLWIPKGTSASNNVTIVPVTDATLVLDGGSTPATDTMLVSLHHSTPSARRLAFVRFDLSQVQDGKRYLLKITGHNIGNDATSREILHVYGAGSSTWNRESLAWSSAPGVGKYYTSATTMEDCDGLGDMVDIEDNYGGITSGIGHGLGIYGKFLGPVAFHTGNWGTVYLDVTDYIQSLLALGESAVTFLVARIVRYNVNDYYGTSYYSQGVYDYDGRIVEIGALDNADPALRPGLVVWKP